MVLELELFPCGSCGLALFGVVLSFASRLQVRAPKCCG